MLAHLSINTFNFFFGFIPSHTDEKAENHKIQSEFH